MGASALIASQLERLKADFGLSAVVACEIEFYLHGSDRVDLAPFWREASEACEKVGISIFKYEKEKGHEQHEIALLHVNDATLAAIQAQTLIPIVEAAAAQYGMRADFSARPVEGQPGSGLHVHIHLEDAQGNRVFYKDDTIISDALKHSIGGLLLWLPDCMPVFAPYEKSYARFTEKANAPVTVSWGANNRTVAVRLPDAPHDQKRIEHRVAGADADPARVIAVILAAIHYGLTHKCNPGEQIYGDAAMEQYNLPRLPTSLEEAQTRMQLSPYPIT